MTTLVVLVFLVPATATCGYYFLLSTLGWARRRPAAPAVDVTFTVVIPAHDEEGSVAASIRSVLASVYPPDRVRVLVVADNCTDRTAAIARGLGVECVEREDPTRWGKGYAVAVGLEHPLAAGADGVLILDADCRLDPAALGLLAAALRGGAGAVQAAVVTEGDAGAVGIVAAVGSRIQNGVSAGQDRLGRSAALRGTGMAFRRDVLEREPWAAYGVTEDAEYGERLRRAGVRVRFAADAEVRSAAAPSLDALYAQRRRWRHALRVGSPVRVHRFLNSKPLVLAHLAATVAAVAGLVAVAPAGATFLAAWTAVVVTLTAVVYGRAVVGCGARLGGAVGVWHTSIVVARLAWVTAAGAARRPGRWQRTPRTPAGVGRRA